jgi:glycine cleavage system H protein
MNIDHCEFPDDLYYDVENDIWFQIFEEAGSKIGRMGITNTLVFVSGKISSIRFRPVTNLKKGQSIATIESIRYVGAVRSPVNGKVARFNQELASNPARLWKSPYDSWLMQYESFEESSLGSLLQGPQAKEKILERIKELRLHCFKLLPDEEMLSIGTECTTTLANLSELLEDKANGFVVHLVTDDPTADIELARWSMQTGNEIVESRKEDNLYHFIVKKIAKDRN